MTALRARVLVAPLSRERGLAVALVPAPPRPPRVPARRPAKIARTLALAHHIQLAIDSGKLANAADAARQFGLTRARLSQLLDLLLLAPDIQEEVLHMEAIDGVEPTTERRLRNVVRMTSWTDQRQRCASSR